MEEDQEINIGENRIVLFGPKTGKSLKKLYPELSEEKEFKELSNDDLLFSWYMGIPGSPVDQKWSDNVRYKQAAYIVFTDKKDPKREAYASMNVPENVKIATERFRKYNVDVRLMSKTIVQTMFNNISELVNAKKEDFIDEDGNIDWTGRKQYIDSCAKISETIPTLIKQIEEGFGVEEKKSDTGSGAKAIDRFHQS